jgi:hypothetical protein
MKSAIRPRISLVLVGFVLWSPVALGAPKDVDTILKMIPGDAPVSGFALNLVEFEKSLGALTQRLDPEEEKPTIIADLKEEIPFAAAADFTKPVGFVARSLGDLEEPMVLLPVADFETRIKEHGGKPGEDGIWSLGEVETLIVYLKPLAGGYVAVAGSKEELAAVGAPEKSLASLMKGRKKLLHERDLFIHVNVEAFQQTAEQKLAQFGAAIPMFAMMAAQGGDPITTIATLTALFEGFKSFVAQLTCVDIAINLDEKVGAAAVAASFKEGGIKSFLAKTKPAKQEFFTNIEDQPFFIAVGSHVPGGMSELFDYLLKTFEQSVQTAAPMAGPQADPSAALENFKVSVEMNKMTEGGNMLMALSPDGMKMISDLIVKDTDEYMALFRKSEETVGPMIQQFGGGMEVETLGPTKIQGVDVEMFKLKAPAAQPGMPAMPSFLAEGARYGVGVVKDRVRQCMGNEKDMQEAFKAKTENPLSASERMKDALKSVPKKHNMVVLVDPMGLLPFARAFMPGAPPQPPQATPAEPILIWISLSGDPAEMEISVPLQTIEQLVRSTEPPEPT